MVELWLGWGFDNTIFIGNKTPCSLSDHLSECYTIQLYLSLSMSSSRQSLGVLWNMIVDVRNVNKIVIEGVIPLIHGGLSVLLGEYLYTRGERNSIQTLKPSL